MSKMYYKDENSEFVEIPALKGDKGDNGQSAYEAAVKGGYSGTQEEFYLDLASVEESTPEALSNTEIEEILSNFA